MAVNDKKYVVRSVPVELLNQIEALNGGRTEWELFLIYIFKHAKWGKHDDLERNEYRVDLTAIAKWVYGVEEPTPSHKTQMSRYVKRAVMEGYVTRRSQPARQVSGQMYRASVLTLSPTKLHGQKFWEFINEEELLEKFLSNAGLSGLIIGMLSRLSQTPLEIINEKDPMLSGLLTGVLTELLTFLRSKERSKERSSFEETPEASIAEKHDPTEERMRKSIERDDETAHDLVDTAPKPLPPLTQEQAFATEDPAKAILDHERKRDTLFLPQEFIWLGVIFWVLKACWYDLDCTTPEPQVPKKKLAYPLLGALRRYSQTGKLDANTAYWICNALIFMRDKVHDGSWQTGWLSHIVLHDRPLGNAIHRVKKHFDETGEAYSMPESVFGDPKATYEAGRDIWVPNAMTAFQARASVREAQRHTHLVSDVAQMLTQKALAQSQEKE